MTEIPGRGKSPNPTLVGSLPSAPCVEAIFRYKMQNSKYGVRFSLMHRSSGAPNGRVGVRWILAFYGARCYGNVRLEAAKKDS